MRCPWWVYLLRCSDGSLYCGATKCLAERVKRHNQGKGSKYVRSRLPAEPVWSRICKSKSEALKLEHSIKKLSRSDKLKLIEGAMNEQSHRQDVDG